MIIGEVIPLWVYVVVVWSLVWKAIASWKAARNGHVVWFILFWVLNTAGILPIIYILFFSEGSGGKKVSVKKNVRKKSKK